MNDPTPEIYQAMDRAGLVPGVMLSKRVSMEKIVNDIRAKLVADIKQLIEKREVGNGA